MGFLDKAKKMAEKAAPLIDKAAPHARTVVDNAGQQIDKRTGGKYHDRIKQVEQKVGEHADKRIADSGTGPAAAADGFPPTPPPATPATDTPSAAPMTGAPMTDGAPTSAGPTGGTMPVDDAGTNGSSGTGAPPPATEPDAPGDRPTP